MLPMLPLRALLIINLVLGCLVVLSNGSALLIVLFGGRAAIKLSEILPWIVGGATLIFISILALRQQSVPIIEKFVWAQAVVFAVAFVALAIYGIQLTTKPMDTTRTFTWSLGFVTALGVYLAVLLARLPWLESAKLVKLALLVGFGVVSLSVDLFILFRLAP